MLKNITIRTRLIFVIALLCIELVVGAAIGLLSLGHANREMHATCPDGMVPMGQLDQVVRKLNLNQLAVAQALTAEPERRTRLLADIEQNGAVIRDQWQAYSRSNMDDAEREKAQRFEQARTVFLDTALQPAVDALRQGDAARATALVQGPMNALFEPVRAAINALIQQQLDDAAQADARSQSTFETVRLVCLSGMALGLVLALVVGTMLVRGIVDPLEEAASVAQALRDEADSLGRAVGAFRVRAQSRPASGSPRAPNGKRSEAAFR